MSGNGHMTMIEKQQRCRGETGPVLGRGDVTGIYAELAWADTFVTENRFSWRGANAKAVLETGNGIADCCRRHVQIEGRRAEASVPGDSTTASSSINPLLYIVTILWLRHRSLSRLSPRSKSVMVQPYSMTQGG